MKNAHHKTATPPEELPEEAPSGRAVIYRQDGRELCQIGVYLPATLARRLRIHCAENDASASDVVTDAVEHFLASRAEPG